MNPNLIEAATGHEVKYCADKRKPHVVAIGSMMAATSSASEIWGTGVMHPRLGVGGARAENIHALRGPDTLKALQDAGVAVRDVPFGDPGFLAPQILNIKRSTAPRFQLGVVAHYVDRSRPLIQQLLAEDGVADLNVHDDGETFLRRMAECETIVSTSLHGLIFAEALQIPNLWMQAGDEIVGGTFKYDDWFATTRRPQKLCHQLSALDRASEISKKAVLHDSLIDTAALLAAFPRDRLDSLVEPVAPDAYSVAECRRRPLPAFLISYNRGAMLQASIAGLKKQTRATDIVIHDNGSTDPATLTVLQSLEQEGTRIYRAGAITTADDLNLVNNTVSDYFSRWAEPQPYVVSDCDVDLSVASPNALDVYRDLLNQNRKASCVGPMLRIRDIPTSYPLYNRAINRHVEQFWCEIPRLSGPVAASVAVIDADIDTTLGMHRAGEPFKRLKPGLRVYEPYEALHLDWYITTETSEALTYAATSSPQISHWNNQVGNQTYRDEKLNYTCFNAVRPKDGQLETYLERLSMAGGAPVETADGPIKPFVAADEEERAERVSYTETLRSQRVSDIGRWGKPASHYKDWQKRVAAMATFIHPGERILEFGAGKSELRDYLPADCMYTGCDLAPLNDDTLFYDLNAQRLPLISGFDVAFLSGVLEYVHDLNRLVAFQHKCFQTVICSYATARQGMEDEVQKRRYSGWVSDFTLTDFLTLFEQQGFTKHSSSEWQAQHLFRFDKA